MDIILIGCGNMGEAMLQGLREHNLKVVEASPNRLDYLLKKYPDITFVNKIPNIDNSYVIIAVKPQSFNFLHLNGKAKGIISIAAGIKLDKIKECGEADYYVRAMPNIAAFKKESATALSGDRELKDIAVKILESIGKCYWLGSEDEIDITTALAGSAPAWLALVAEALSDGAVNAGLSRENSYKFLRQLFVGFSRLLEDEHPALIKDKVMSPAGTTAAGYAALEEGGVRDSFIKAIMSAYNRSQDTS